MVTAMSMTIHVAPGIGEGAGCYNLGISRMNTWPTNWLVVTCPESHMSSLSCDQDVCFKSLSIETSVWSNDTVTVVCLPMCTWLNLGWLIAYWCVPDTDRLLTNARTNWLTRYNWLVLMIDKVLTVVLGLVIAYLPITKVAYWLKYLLTDRSTCCI